jgi:hypothetical protein
MEKNMNNTERATTMGGDRPPAVRQLAVRTTLLQACETCAAPAATHLIRGLALCELCAKVARQRRQRVHMETTRRGGITR